MASADEIKVKGNTFLSVLKSLAAWKGDDAAERVKAALGGEVGEALRLGTLMATSWYPVSWYRSLYQAILDVVGGGEDTVRHLGRASTAVDMNGAYRLLMKVLSVERVFSQSARMLSQYYSGVQCQVVESAPGLARVRYRGFTGFNRLLWVELMASAEMVMEAAGARKVVQNVLRGGTDGSADMDLELRWS